MGVTIPPSSDSFSLESTNPESSEILRVSPDSGLDFLLELAMTSPEESILNRALWEVSALVVE